MKKLNDLKIGARLNLVFNLAFVVIISLLGVYTITSQRRQLVNDTDTRMFEQVNDLASIIKEQIKQGQNTTRRATDVGIDLIFTNNHVVSTGQSFDIQAKNQSTKEVQQLQIKKVTINGNSLYNSTTYVDEVSKLTGVVCTILQKTNAGYVRISTSVIQKDGNRAINTLIPNDSPVALALDKGEEFVDRAVVLDEWYLTAYKGFTLNDGTQLVVATGTPEKDMSSLKEYFSSKKYFDSGYPFLVDNTGNLIIHPTKEGSNEKDSEFFKQLQNDKSGYGSGKYSWEGRVKKQYYKYLPEIESYVAASIFQDEFLKIVRRTTYAILVAVLIGIGIFIIITVALSRSITRALKQGVEFAKKISRGDLTATLIVDQHDEIGDLADSLTQMLDKLREIVLNIRTGADSIAAASSQISNGSQQLSQGATEQASSTEEISSSMEEMVSNIQQNTDNARQTENISGKATDSMIEMSKIGRESFDTIQTIAEKITIINDIAFQTNLLALNAAVEAARAGEHGRGFAVVAAEVRKLAERSKLAADEIESLSRNSLKITEKSRESLEALVPEIQKTSQLVQEITAASVEQNSGADQINSAIQQLNIVTQQNAASSEEMATSAEELSAQAETLKEAVAYFKVGDEDKIQKKYGENNFKKHATQTKAASSKIRETLHHEPKKTLGTVASSDKDFENF
ncbi:MAG TPA: Cache 3/Cache 2 fusion domain-containing protein [Bacteroidales bacterium]|nr:Cache 3/Cache 2 fusion domain-containing protein [Bacteroidales bacterium]